MRKQIGYDFIWQSMTPDGIRSGEMDWGPLVSSSVRATRGIILRFRLFSAPEVGFAVSVQDTWLHVRSCCLVYPAAVFRAWADSEDFSSARVCFDPDGITTEPGRKRNRFVKISVNGRLTSASSWELSKWRDAFIVDSDRKMAASILEA